MRRLAWSLALPLLAFGVACGKKDEPRAQKSPPETATADQAPELAAEEQAKPEATSSDPPAPMTIARASKSAPGSIKSVKNLGFRPKKLDGLYALDATTATVDWSQSGEGTGELSRDDNLDSAWQCTPAGGQSCALGLSFGETAKVEVLRLFVAAGPRHRDYRDNPRVKTLRIHTEQGYLETTLSDGPAHKYLRFDPPLEGSALAIELLDGHGKKPGALRIAEIEAYGRSGPARAAWELDPSQSFANFETTPWKSKTPRDHTVRHSYLSFLGERDSHPRFMRATALYGKRSDRFLLAEKAYQSNCGEHKISYMLIDQKNRLVLPFNVKTAGAPVYRHRQGRGFFVGHLEGDQAGGLGLVHVEGEFKTIRLKDGPDSPRVQLAEAAFDTDPFPRGGLDFDAPGLGCTQASAEDKLAAELKDDDRRSWQRCELPGGARLMATQADQCSTAWELVHIDGNGKLSRFEGKSADARPPRLTRDATGLVIEVSERQSQNSRLFRADETGLKLLGKGALAVRAPAGCGCELDFAAPGTGTEVATTPNTGDPALDPVASAPSDAG